MVARPVFLNGIFSSVTSLPGVGDAARDRLYKLTISRVKDLIWQLPVSCVDRREMPDLRQVESGALITAKVRVSEHHSNFRKKGRPYRIVAENDTGFLTFVFFNAREDYLKRQFPIGEERVVSGRVELYDGQLQMAHPEYVEPVKNVHKVAQIQPIYPLTQGLHRNRYRQWVEAAMKKLPEFPEWQDATFKVKQGFPDAHQALRQLHFPKTVEVLELESNPRRRLAYDELLASQLALSLTRRFTVRKGGKAVNGDGVLRNQLLKSLPFELTNGQRDVLETISAEMTSHHRMIRLLQGDVGSGKTIVALLAMLQAVEAGKQAALMAPTDILARQHVQTIQGLVEQAGLQDEIQIGLLSGKDPSKTRELVQQDVSEGKRQLVIGTHALFQAGVEFDDLALVVVDEQHRFGVKQRLALAEKGEGVDMLLMTATPIPRTLLMTLYGDMEVSSLHEKPAGRQPIDTRVVSSSKLESVMEGLKRAVLEGNRVYWVCPLIEEQEDEDNQNPLAAAEVRFMDVQKAGLKAGLVHGKMKAPERDLVMEQFIAGEIDVLVATTVIEVGVNVPEATIMVIEQAERFGLSQLHQLRGRVGRSSAKSSCILLYGNRLGEVLRQRLKIMRETEDGFRIAEEDLRLRGGGEILGTKQSGLPQFSFAVLPEHQDLMLAARDDAKLIIEQDAQLKTPRGEALKLLLYLFEYDAQMRFLEAG